MVEFRYKSVVRKDVVMVEILPNRKDISTFKVRLQYAETGLSEEFTFKKPQYLRVEAEVANLVNLDTSYGTSYATIFGNVGSARAAKLINVDGNAENLKCNKVRQVESFELVTSITDKRAGVMHLTGSQLNNLTNLTYNSLFGFMCMVVCTGNVDNIVSDYINIQGNVDKAESDCVVFGKGKRGN